MQKKTTKFEKGVSGNPGGRPKSPTSAMAFKEQLQMAGPDIINKCIMMALLGDSGAMRLCIERLIPKIKDEGEGDAASAEQVAAVLATSQVLMTEMREKYKREY